MAAGARNFAFAIRHVRGALKLCSSHLVALKAQFWLRFLRAHMFGQRLAVTLVFRGQIGQCDVSFGHAAVVNLVTIHASHGARFVRASCPEHLVAFGMTRKAGSIPFVDWRVRILGKPNWDGVLSTTSINVCLARPVTRFAAKLFLRSFGMHQHGVAHDGVFETLLLVRMAGSAHLTPYIVGGSRVRVSTRRRGGGLSRILGPAQRSENQKPVEENVNARCFPGLPRPRRFHRARPHPSAELKMCSSNLMAICGRNTWD